MAQTEKDSCGSQGSRLTATSLVTMHELVMHPEDESWIVGRIGHGEFVAMPRLGVSAIRLLLDGHTPLQAQQRLEPEYGAVEVLSFVGQLQDLGFVRAIDGISLDEPGDQREMSASLPWLRQRQVSWLFRGPLLAVYAAICAVALAILVTRPRLLPRYGDLFVSRSMTTVVVADTAMILALMTVHELAHLIAARSVGVPARITWGTRLFDLVAQTRMPGVWGVPRRERMRCYLAGPACELVLASVVLIVLAAGNPHDTGGRIGRAIVALVLLGILMQLLVYQRTDVYFVVADLLRARNLHDDACRYLLTRLRVLAGWVRRRSARAASSPLPATMDRREYRVVRCYAWVMVAGSAASAAALAAFIIPAIATVFARGRAELMTGLSRQDYFAVADAAAALAILCGFWVLFLVVFIRSRGEWWRRIRGAGD